VGGGGKKRLEARTGKNRTEEGAQKNEVWRKGHVGQYSGQKHEGKSVGGKGTKEGMRGGKKKGSQEPNALVSRRKKKRRPELESLSREGPLNLRWDQCRPEGKLTPLDGPRNS